MCMNGDFQHIHFLTTWTVINVISDMLSLIFPSVFSILERTLKRFKDLNDTWEYQRQHVRYFIDHCPCCQKMKMLKIPIHAHGFTTSTYTPMECLNIDFIGPFPDQGYILVIVDTFTRWVELYHTTDATALSADEVLQNDRSV